MPYAYKIHIHIMLYAYYNNVRYTNFYFPPFSFGKIQTRYFKATADVTVTPAADKRFEYIMHLSVFRSSVAII